MMADSWQEYLRSSHVESATFVQVAVPLDANSKHLPGTDLISIYDAEHEAANMWHKNRIHDDRWSYGWVSLRFQGVELIDPELRFDIYTFWNNVVRLVEDYLDEAYGEFPIPETPIPIRITNSKGKTFFVVGESRTLIDSKSFISDLVDEAARFFDWTVRHIGDAAPLREIDEIKQRLR
jgi:hypothetical protein